ncbi:DUF3093 domain-containing protein [Parafrigoribacterium mesophilum]|uniref:DUF3093 domain-containing protein n=1 Tax=Parafrigoribacterium mesophilum TaxID=433646 RepID=UPI0031FC3244
MTDTPAETLYRERLWASVWFFLATALVIPATLLVFFPISMGVGIAVAVLLYAGCVALLIANSAVLEVTTEAFHAGRARLPIEFLGEATGYREPEATVQRGPQLDARAWLLIRGWVSPVVRVTVTDEQDPTPYWLVSTRHPEKLVEALETARRQATESPR